MSMSLKDEVLVSRLLATALRCTETARKFVDGVLPNGILEVESMCIDIASSLTITGDQYARGLYDEGIPKD